MGSFSSDGHGGRVPSVPVAHRNACADPRDARRRAPRSRPRPDRPSPAQLSVLCHPHPLYGGERIERRRRRRVPAPHRSSASPCCGSTSAVPADQRARTAAASTSESTWRPLSTRSRSVTDAPLWIVGYSFGASVALDVAHPRADGWVAIAPPLAVMPGERIAGTDHRPKHLLVPRTRPVQPARAHGRRGGRVAGHDRRGDRGRRPLPAGSPPTRRRACRSNGRPELRVRTRPARSSGHPDLTDQFA